MRSARLAINTYGRVARYGDDVFKVAHGDRLLLENGWHVVRRDSGVAYLRAPAAGATARPIVPVEIPEREEVLRFASDLHAQAAPWEGEAFGWPARYEPREEERPARFHLGEQAVWSVHVTWTGDEPAYRELDDNLVKD